VGYQPGSHGVVEDVESDGPDVLVTAYNVLEEARLPASRVLLEFVQASGRPAFDVAYPAREISSVDLERAQDVRVIWHDAEAEDVDPALLVEAQRIHDNRRGGLAAQCGRSVECSPAHVEHGSG
jgi:hypothetical protein